MKPLPPLAGQGWDEGGSEAWFAAAALGITFRALRYRLKKPGID